MVGLEIPRINSAGKDVDLGKSSRTDPWFMAKTIAELFEAGDSQMRCLASNSSKHRGLRGIGDVNSERGVAKTFLTKRIRHYSAIFCRNLEGCADDIDAVVNDTILEGPTHILDRVKELGTGE
jgi:hypothetical protein